jgi:isohexenylglutaconyl-CoA hydratase
MAELPQTKVVRLERSGFRLIATIDDPATRNAMTDELVADLFAVLDATTDDRGIRVLVLQGANGAFCAGANLKGTIERLKADLKLDETDPLFTANRRGGELYAKLNAHPMLVIAVVDGPAFGGGLGLASCADIVLATPRARFALSETGECRPLRAGCKCDDEALAARDGRPPAGRPRRRGGDCVQRVLAR